MSGTQSIDYTPQWVAYTYNKLIANTYRVEDKRPNFYAIKHGKQQIKRYVPLYIKQNLAYYLPPSTHRVATPSPLTRTLPPTLQLRPIQTFALQDITEYSHNHKSTLLTMPTGSGKSFLIMWLAAANSGKTLIVANSMLINEWLLEKFQTHLPHLNTQQLTGAKIKSTDIDNVDILICTPASTKSAREKLNERATVLLVDEAHHLSDTLKFLLCTSNSRIIVWFTATVDHQIIQRDGLLQFYSNIIEKEAPILPTDIYIRSNTYHRTLQQYEEAVGKQNDPLSSEVWNTLLDTDTDRYADIRTAIKDCPISIKNKHRVIIYFNRTISIDNMLEYMSQQKHNYKLLRVDWSTDKKKFLNDLKELNDQPYMICAMSQCVSDGFDVPELQLGVLAFNTSRRVTLIQLIGRTNRAYQDKEKWYLIDMSSTIIVWHEWEQINKKQSSIYQRKKIYKDNNFTTIII